MLSYLTEYFIKNRKLYIPTVGSFKLVALPAKLDFADRRIYPPAYQVSFVETEEEDEAQIKFISEATGLDLTTAKQELSELGQQIKNKLLESAVSLNGLGILELVDEKFVFHSQAKNLLHPVTANKVIRENAHHAVLVGEQEMQSNNMHEVRHIEAKKMSTYILVAFIILISAMLFIAYRFYSKGFTPSSAGLD